MASKEPVYALKVMVRTKKGHLKAPVQKMSLNRLLKKEWVTDPKCKPPKDDDYLQGFYQPLLCMRGWHVASLRQLHNWYSPGKGQRIYLVQVDGERALSSNKAAFERIRLVKQVNIRKVMKLHDRLRGHYWYPLKRGEAWQTVAADLVALYPELAGKLFYVGGTDYARTGLIRRLPEVTQ